MRSITSYRGYSISTDPKSGWSIIYLSGVWISQAPSVVGCERIIDDWLCAA